MLIKKIKSVLVFVMLLLLVAACSNKFSITKGITAKGIT